MVVCHGLSAMRATGAADALVFGVQSVRAVRRPRPRWNFLPAWRVVLARRAASHNVRFSLAEG